jgi:hypothetical protein
LFIAWTWYFALILPFYLALFPQETYFIPYPFD